MQVYTFDFICECQDFNHNEEFVLKEDLDSEMESKQKEITALEARGKKLVNVLSVFLLTNNHADFCRFKYEEECNCMDRSFYNHEKDLERARQVLKDLGVEG